VLRELLDNAIDSRATAIDVKWDAGGVERITVSDDGCGLTPEDLELCWLPHTTSKIQTVEDLDHLTSLGFRGEALASIASCSRLSLLSSTDDSGLAHCLEVDNGRAVSLRKSSGPRGTRLSVENLFHEIPARRRFLKLPSAESGMCRKTFDEKALAFPNLAFRLWIDGKLKLDLPAQTRQERLAQLWPSPWDQPEQIREFSGGSADARWDVWVILPPHHRGDRKGIHLWANGRPLQEYSFVQAVCHAFEGWLPGGAYPYAVVFLTIDPALVDFNIHPAKREARFRTGEQLHRSLVETLRGGLSSSKSPAPLFYETPTKTSEELPWTPTQPTKNLEILRGRARLPSLSHWDPGSVLREAQKDFRLPEPPTAFPADSAEALPSYPFRYLGQILGVFLVVELEENIYLIDQHAAHERLLYDELRNSAQQKQALLIPRRIVLEKETVDALLSRKGEWEALGIGLERRGETEVDLTSLPQNVVDREGLVVEFLCSSLKTPEDLQKELYASISCRSAVMDGDPLDPQAARELVDRTLHLENARCPHGRPLWVKLTRNELFEKIGRLV
jgi:DNA mismatch repair protein MutL